MPRTAKTKPARFSIDSLLERLYAIAEGVEGKPLHWLDPGDTGESYCCDCAEKAASDDEMIDGGWGGQECDLQEFCADCGVPLLCAFTDHGVKEEVESAAELDAIDPTTAWTLTRIIDCGFPRLTERCGDHRYMPELLPALKRIWKRLPHQPREEG